MTPPDRTSAPPAATSGPTRRLLLPRRWRTGPESPTTWPSSRCSARSWSPRASRASWWTAPTATRNTTSTGRSCRPTSASCSRRDRRAGTSRRSTPIPTTTSAGTTPAATPTGWPRWPSARSPAAAAPAATRGKTEHSRPGRDGALLALAVDDQVEPLVAEAHPTGDPRVLRDRRRIAPGRVLDHPVPHPRRPPRGHALVRAARGGGAGQQLDPDVLGRQVVAHR